MASVLSEPLYVIFQSCICNLAIVSLSLLSELRVTTVQKVFFQSYLMPGFRMTDNTHVISTINFL